MKTEFLRRMNLGHKMALIAAGFSIPILLLSGLHAKKFSAEINQANSELGGLADLGALWPVFHAAAASEFLGEAKGRDAGAAKAVEALAVANDTNPWLKEKLRKFLSERKAGRDSVLTMRIGAESFIAIRDVSGLFVDPNLDTVYLTDLLTAKLPVVLEATHGLQFAVHSVMAPDADLTKSANILTYGVGRLQTALAPIRDSFGSLTNASNDQLVGDHLKDPLRKFLTAQESYKVAIARLSGRPAHDKLTNIDAEIATEGFRKLTAATDNLYKSTLSEMHRLTSNRLENLWWSAGVSLAIVLACLVIVGSFILKTVQSIRRPVNNLVGAIEKLRNGDTGATVEHTNDQNEIGEIARGLESFRATVDELEVTRQHQTALMEVELQRAKEISEFAVVISDVVDAAKEGDFTRRVPIENRTGAIYALSKGVNELTETVDRGLSETVRMMAALAAGDMTQKIVGEFKGSFLKLQTDANLMAEKFRTVTRRIAGVSQQVHSANEEIATGFADLSVRTEHHASSLEETSASMTEIAATVKQNSINAQDANAAATAARDTAIGGGEIAGKAVEAMARIEGSSRQIVDIVALIQDIAFQTNLLALNAAVEAARAGESGKGFTVVANEVRSLSQRASQASKDIKKLIVNSDAEIQQGVALVKRAGVSLGDIVASVKKVAALVSEISAATTEQSAGIEQVSKAIVGMDQMTQQNAALVEETNAALQQAQDEVQDLRRAVSFFKTGDTVGEEEPGTSASSQGGNVPGPLRRPDTAAGDLRGLAQKMAGAKSAVRAHGSWKEF